MQVIGAALHQTVAVGVQVLAEHADKVRPLRHVEQMLDDAIGDEQFAVIVPVQPPGIGGAPGKRLKALPGGVEAPHAAIEGRPLRLRSSRFADVRGVRDAIAAIEPAVRSPLKVVEDVVPGPEAPAVQDDLGFSGRFVLARLDGDEQQVGRGTEPDSAEANGDAREVGAIVEEDLAALELPRAGILEDQDAVLAGLPLGQPVRIGSRLDHPEPTAVVRGHGDWFADIRLTGEQMNPKPFRNLHPLGRLFRGGEIVLSKSGTSQPNQGQHGKQARQHGKPPRQVEAEGRKPSGQSQCSGEPGGLPEGAACFNRRACALPLQTAGSLAIQPCGSILYLDRLARVGSAVSTQWSLQ